MKKLLFVIAAAALFASCGGRDYYFAEEKAYTYTDAEAEFDTLSYAVGMNLGLNVSLNYGAEGMTIEPLKEAFMLTTTSLMPIVRYLTTSATTVCDPMRWLSVWLCSPRIL